MTASTTVISYSYFNLEEQRHLIDIDYCGVITDETASISTEATLSFTKDGVHIMNSPLTVNMIPGPFNLALSSFVEWSPEDGCVAWDTCYARFDPRDDARNLLR